MATTTLSHKTKMGVDVYSSLPLFLAVGKRGCRHSLAFWVTWNIQFCGLCFLREGYVSELPGKLHLSKTLADNGNPQQTGRFEAHVSVAEGIYPPLPTQSLVQFSRARGRINSRPSPNSFPFLSAIWEVMGMQPPLGIPLAQSVRGFGEQEIARKMNLTLFNTVDRLSKGVDMAVRLVKKYDDKRSYSAGAPATEEEHVPDSPPDSSR